MDHHSTMTTTMRRLRCMSTVVMMIFTTAISADVSTRQSAVAQPQFDLSVTSNLTIIAGDTALLNCRVSNLGNQTVVWVRHRDINLLTVNRVSYTSDERFSSLHDTDTDVWSLQLKNVSVLDTGVYECQVGITPAIGIPIYLSVVQPITTILGGMDLFINAESTINLTCIVRNLPAPPSFIVWTHNREEVNFDSDRGGVTVITEKGDITTSYLYIQQARKSDEGIYRCSPSNANNATVRVHILLDEQSAAAVQQISSGSYAICRYRLQVTALLVAWALCLWTSHHSK